MITPAEDYKEKQLNKKTCLIGMIVAIACLFAFCSYAQESSLPSAPTVADLQKEIAGLSADIAAQKRSLDVLNGMETAVRTQWYVSILKDQAVARDTIQRETDQIKQITEQIANLTPKDEKKKK